MSIVLYIKKLFYFIHSYHPECDKLVIYKMIQNHRFFLATELHYVAFGKEGLVNLWLLFIIIHCNQQSLSHPHQPQAKVRENKELDEEPYSEHAPGCVCGATGEVHPVAHGYSGNGGSTSSQRINTRKLLIPSP